MATVSRGTLLWTPSEETVERANVTHYQRWLAEHRDLRFGSYNELWEWSVGDLEAFWASIWDFCEVRASKPYERVLGRREMPGAEWFVGAELNYAEHVFARERPHDAAIVHRSETRPDGELTWGELRAQVSRCAAGLRALGVGKGDRVVAYLPNIPETVIAFLATLALGSNLLGSLLGGVATMLSMAIGFRALMFLTLVVYLGALLALSRRSPS